MNIIPQQLLTDADRIYLVDFSWILHRGFHAFSNLSTVIEGVETRSGHVYGVLKAVMDIKAKEPQAQIVLCLDGYPKDRHELYAEYKKGRPSGGYNVHQDVDEITAIASLIPGVWLAFNPNMEADDVIFALAQDLERQLEGEGKIIIHASDRDLMQVISEKTWMLRRWDKDISEYTTPGSVMLEFGVPPAKLPMFRAVTGDSSDNIKGLPRFPRDLLRKVVNASPTVDHMFLCVSARLSSAHQKHLESMKSNKDLVKRNYDLMKLKYCSYDLYKTQLDPQEIDCLITKWRCSSLSRFLERFSE